MWMFYSFTAGECLVRSPVQTSIIISGSKKLHLVHMHIISTSHTHTRLMAFCPGLGERDLRGPRGPLSRTIRVSRYQKGRPLKPIWILLKQETVSGSGISWAICKCACQHPTTQIFTGRKPFLPPNQQRQSTSDT